MGFIFQPDELGAIAKLGIGLPPDEMFKRVTEALVERYGKHINPHPTWIFNNAGGAMGQIALLHGSLSEYLLFFGSAIGTEGHSGRYATEVYDFVMDGEMWCYTEGQFERTVFRPGDTAYLGKAAVKGYRLPEHAWMLEYARGPIAQMLPFGLADSMLSTLDTRTVARTLNVYARLVLKELFVHRKI